MVVVRRLSLLPTPGPFLPSWPRLGDAEQAAHHALAATIAAGNPLSQRQLMARFGLTRAQESAVRQAVTARANGNSAPDPASGAQGISAGQPPRMSPRATTENTAGKENDHGN